MSPAPATTSSVSALPSVGFVHPATGEAAICDWLYVEWFYNGPTDKSNEMTFYISNEGLVFNPNTTSAAGEHSTSFFPTPSESTTSSAASSTTVRGDSFNGDVKDRSTIDRRMTWEMAYNVPPANGHFRWRTAVPPGMYVVVVSFPVSSHTYTFRSLPFNVLGDDVSCLGTATTTSITRGTATAASSSSSSKSHAGSIAGGVVGGLAALAAILAVLFFMRYKNRSKRRNTTRTFADNTQARPWGRLGNSSSAVGAAGGIDQKHRPRSFSQDAKSPTGFGDDMSPTQRQGPPESPTFIRAPPASHDPFSDAPIQQQPRKPVPEHHSDGSDY